jgi:acetyl-CoA carboxylase biotin carboxyl carrier protein
VELSRIKALIELLAGSPIAELELSEGEDHIRLTKAGFTRAAAEPSAVAVPVDPPAEAATGDAGDVVAPMFGVVHLASAPGEPPFVQVGNEVAVGDRLCLVEAMKVFSQVVADRGGVVAAVLVAGGQEVDAGQPLFRIRAEP